MGSEGFVIFCFLGVGFILLLIAVTHMQFQRYQAIQARIKIVEQQEQPAVFLNPWSGLRYQIDTSGRRTGRKDSGVLSISAKQVTLYNYSLKLPEVFSFSPEQVRWFGRPRKYTSGRNEIWLHIEQNESWMLLKMWLYPESMRELVRTLKTVNAPELVTAYRRQRPYIHSGPAKARPATQDIHGAWTLEDPIDLYLMPRFLVILKEEKVVRKIPLEAVQQIGALKRLDQAFADGLVRFRAEEESFAFSLPHYDEFASALAEAAKRTLETPLEQKRKGKDDDEEEWD